MSRNRSRRRSGLTANASTDRPGARDCTQLVEKLEPRLLLAATPRSVTDTVTGNWYPLYTPTYNSLGFFFSYRAATAHFTNPSDPNTVPADSIKGLHTMQMAADIGTNVTHDSAWPSPQLQSYENKSKSMNAPGLFITSGYSASSITGLPTYFVGMNGDDTHDSNGTNWYEALATSIGDDRYINFFINNYARSYLLGPGGTGAGTLASQTRTSPVMTAQPPANTWVSLDSQYANLGEFGPNPDDTDPGATYTGAGWTVPSRSSSYFGGTLHQSKTTGNSMQFSFTGDRIAWVSTPSVKGGKADVYIDGVAYASLAGGNAVDLYSTAAQTPTVVFRKSGLSSGSHTLKIVVDGVNDGKGGAQADNYVYVDGFMADNPVFYSSSSLTSDTGRVAIDAPFPNNQRKYMDATAYFFNRLNELAPDINIHADQGSMATGATQPQHQQVYAGVAGRGFEDFLADDNINASGFESGGLKYNHERWWSYIQQLESTSDDLYKAQFFRFANMASATDTTNLLNNYAAYKVYGGTNSFFDPSEKYQVNSIWQNWEAELGPPTADSAVHLQQPANSNPVTPNPDTTLPASFEWSYRLFGDTTNPGAAIFNRESAPVTINLHTDLGLPNTTYFDALTQQWVSSITLQPDQGDFVTAFSGSRAATPAVSISDSAGKPMSPRLDGPAYGDRWVKLADATAGASIYYTTDSNNPTVNSDGSPGTGTFRYTAPFLVPSGAGWVIKTMAVTAPTVPSSYSWINTSKVSAAPQPTVQFHLGGNGDQQYSTLISGTTVYPETYALVELDNYSSTDVTVNYTVSGSAADYHLPGASQTTGSVTIKAYEKYATIPIQIRALNNSADAHMSLTLTGATGALLGGQRTFNYTILGNTQTKAPKVVIPASVIATGNTVSTTNPPALSGNFTAELTAVAQEMNGGTTNLVNSNNGAPLTYSWSLGGATKTNINDANTADTGSYPSQLQPSGEHIKVTFPSAGVYAVSLSVSDGTTSVSGGSVIFNVNSSGVVTTVANYPQTASSIAITPAGPINLAAGAAQQFSANVYDQFGVLVSPQPAIAWTLGPNSIGTLSTSTAGLYTAPTTGGSASVIATVNGVSASAGLSIVVPPSVQSVMVNDGSPQRSMVASVSLTFNHAATLGGGAITIALHSPVNGGGTVGTLPTLSGLYDALCLLHLGKLTDAEQQLTGFCKLYPNSPYKGGNTSPVCNAGQWLYLRQS